jgi:hypothetical protein
MRWWLLSEKLSAIPWHTLQQSAGFDMFKLDVDKGTLPTA